MEEGTEELLLAKASYDVMLYRAAYATQEEEIAFLKQEYAMEVTEDAGERVQAKVKALEQLLAERGVDVPALRRAVGASQTKGAPPESSPRPGYHGSGDAARDLYDSFG